jgi:hypothetical protein
MAASAGVTRVVMLSGVGGSGKTTLWRGLAGALGERAVFVPELVIFEDPALADIADAFRSKRYPSSAMLLDGWARLLRSHAGADWIVVDGSWVLLAEDLPWAMASWDAIVDHARQLVDIAGGTEAVTVLHLDVSPATAVARRRVRDGVDVDVAEVRAGAERVAAIYAAAGIVPEVIAADGGPDAARRDTLRRLLARP